MSFTQFTSSQKSVNIRCKKSNFCIWKKSWTVHLSNYIRLDATTKNTSRSRLLEATPSPEASCCRYYLPIRRCLI